MCEVVVLSADDWVGVFMLFVVWVRHPAESPGGSWIMLVLAYRWMPLWEFSLINTPWD